VNKKELATHKKVTKKGQNFTLMTEDYLVAWYGPRCRNYAIGCPKCTLWEMLDYIRKAEKIMKAEIQSNFEFVDRHEELEKE
jgi:hypothetical protein